MLGESLLAVMILSVTAFIYSRHRAEQLAGRQPSSLHSRPFYHGLYSALWTAIAGLATAVLLSAAFTVSIKSQLYDALPAEIRERPQIQQDRLVDDAIATARRQMVGRAGSPADQQLREKLAALYKNMRFWQDWVTFGGTLLVTLAVLFLTAGKIAKPFRARNRAERLIRVFLMLAAALAVLTTIGIVLSLIGETLRFFAEIPVWKFLFGTHWSPLSGVHSGVMDPNKVGAVPLFAGTLLITVIAMVVAVPIGLLAAIYLSDFASPAVRAVAKPVLEILAGIPTVVYGFFAAITVAPLIRQAAETIGLEASSQSALAAGTVMGIMIIPFISSLSDDVINAVPQSLRDGSYGLGATKAETITQVVLPAALPGIVSAIILAVSRAIGETMIVVMAAGQGVSPNWWTFNPLEAATTVTVQIVMLITGDTEADTAAGPAFALGFTLFCVTLMLNMLALSIVQKYREKYD